MNLLGKILGMYLALMLIWGVANVFILNGKSALDSFLISTPIVIIPCIIIAIIVKMKKK